MVYLDDLIITGNDDKLIQDFIDQFSAKFSLKELGELNFFLGVKVLPTPTGLFLSQRKYVLDLLEKFKMENQIHIQLQSQLLSSLK